MSGNKIQSYQPPVPSITPNEHQPKTQTTQDGTLRSGEGTLHIGISMENQPTPSEMKVQLERDFENFSLIQQNLSEMLAIIFSGDTHPTIHLNDCQYTLEQNTDDKSVRAQLIRDIEHHYPHHSFADKFVQQLKEIASDLDK